MTNRLNTLALAGITSMGLLIGCGDATEPDTLDSADITAITNALISGLNAANAASFSKARVSNVAASPWISTNVAVNVPVSGSAPCPVAGHVTFAGNIFVDDKTGNTQGTITMQYGDRTNNLADCEVAGGVIVDGTITLTISGGQAGIALGMAGTLSVNRRGQSGGLHPLGSCLIQIHVAANANTATGSVCGQSI
jgi:hypothetical protein